jgi:hypothetical protein
MVNVQFFAAFGWLHRTVSGTYGTAEGTLDADAAVV